MFLAWLELIIIPITLVFRFLPPDTVIFYACAFVALMAAMMTAGPIFASVQDLVPIRIRSTAIGMVILGHNLFGAAPGNFFAGYMCDLLRAAGWEQPMTYGTFFTRLVGMLSIPMFFIAARYYRRDIERVQAEDNE